MFAFYCATTTLTSTENSTHNHMSFLASSTDVDVVSTSHSILCLMVPTMSSTSDAATTGRERESPKKRVQHWPPLGLSLSLSFAVRLTHRRIPLLRSSAAMLSFFEWLAGPCCRATRSQTSYRICSREYTCVRNRHLSYHPDPCVTSICSHHDVFFFNWSAMPRLPKVTSVSWWTALGKFIRRPDTSPGSKNYVFFRVLRLHSICVVRISFSAS